MRKIRNAALAVVLGFGGAVVGFGQPAHAALINCVYGRNGLTLSATCINTRDTGWHYRLHCIRYAGSREYNVNGTLVFGSGTSRANCGHVGEPMYGTLVEL